MYLPDRVCFHYFGRLIQFRGLVHGGDESLLAVKSWASWTSNRKFAEAITWWNFLMKLQFEHVWPCCCCVAEDPTHTTYYFHFRVANIYGNRPGPGTWTSEYASTYLRAARSNKSSIVMYILVAVSIVIEQDFCACWAHRPHSVWVSLVGENRKFLKMWVSGRSAAFKLTRNQITRAGKPPNRYVVMLRCG